MYRIEAPGVDVAIVTFTGELYAPPGGVNVGAGVCGVDSCASIPPPPGGVARVRCELRTGRSRISVDGNNLAPGSYRARVTSGGASVDAPAQAAVGDEVEFDFDSDGGDIAAGATAIPADFIQGTPPQATGSNRPHLGAASVEDVRRYLGETPDLEAVLRWL